MERGRALFNVIGIYAERFGKLAGGTCELTEHKYTRVIVPRCNELFRHKIHPVMKAADEAEL